MAAAPASLGFRWFFGEQIRPPRLSLEADRAEADAVLHAIENYAVDATRRDRAFSNWPAEQTEVRDDLRPLVFRRLRKPPQRQAIDGLERHPASPQQAEIGRVDDSAISGVARCLRDDAGDLVG